MALILDAIRIGPAVLFVGFVALVFAVFVIVDMARRPNWQWERAGSSKTLWLVLEVVLVLLTGILAIVWGILYLAITRPKLVAVEQQGQGPPGWSGGWPGTGTATSYPGTGAPSYPGTGAPSYPGAGAPGAAPPYPGASAQPAPAPSAPPFGWYPDPSGRHQLRYWDGTRWTEHVSDGDERDTDPLPT